MFVVLFALVTEPVSDPRAQALSSEGLHRSGKVVGATHTRQFDR